jgi:hypothetical protein
VPITISRPQSYAAAAFHELAALFTAGSEQAAEPVAVAAASQGGGRRALFRQRRK